MFDKFIPWPENPFEWAINNWPVRIGYWLLGILAVAGLFTLRLRTSVSRWVLIVPLVWLGWQFVSATQTIDAELTRPTLYHFTACVVCFYLGVFCLSREQPLLFWVPILCAMLVVAARGFEQHFGGLEETRRYFFTYVYPQSDSVPAEYLKRISSDRIFSTLFYPNALAGAILLLLPMTLVTLWQISGRLTFAARCFLIGLYGAVTFACLYWSGSKGGWLLALFSGLVALLHLPFAGRLKILLVALLLVSGGVGFFWKYSVFFEHGAKSVHARFDYWRAAAQTAAAKPFLGTGPGTFGNAYKAVKRPESEMTRLTHNDYLEQASDSGSIGFVAYVTWVWGILWFGYCRPKSPKNFAQFAVWLGVLGWMLQGVTEFGLYIPALAWIAFCVSGWILNANAKEAVRDYSKNRND